MSPSSDDHEELDKLAEFLGGIVHVQQPGRLLPDSSIRAKMDFLERAIAVWRFNHHCLENKLRLEHFVQGKVFVDGKVIHFQESHSPEDLGSGTPPIALQPRFLMFLLLYHRKAYAVYDIIETFIDKVWDKLGPLDFKKTLTGVTRCFTNTRFAAHTLRDYGLLKFTRKEAYKTWVLSLPGFLVASKIIQPGAVWGLSNVERLFHLDLHPQILSAWDELQTFDDFVGRLADVCEPNVEVFETFQGVLENAYKLLPGYWRALQNHEVSQKDRKAETAKRLAALDQLPNMDAFYKQFSACVNVERLLADVDPAG